MRKLWNGSFRMGDNMIELKGLRASEKIKAEIEERLKLSDTVPTLAIVRVGEKPDDLSYERSAAKKMNSFGLAVKSFVFPLDIGNKEFQQEFAGIQDDHEVSGILLLRPLPKHIDEKEIERMIDPQKDLDGISPYNMARVFAGEDEGFAPCTAEAVVELLKEYEIPIEGKRVTIVGRSLVVGKPLSMLLLKEHATVTICHTRTVDLKAACQNAEIVVAAAGKAKMLDASYIGKDAVVIDVGINADEDGKLCGDVDYESLKGWASMATPVPGGIGAVTTAVLAKHLVRAAMK